MSKIELDPVASGHNLQKINSNFQRIEEALNEHVLYRENPEGETNTMENDLDMNSFQIINLPAPSSLNSPARLRDVQEAVVDGVPSASVIPFTPTVNISAVTIQAAIEEVYAEAASFTQVGTSAVERTLQDKIRDFEITPEDFDNGSRTDQQLITLALAAIASVGYGRLRLLRMYELSTMTQVPNHCEIFGTRETGFTVDSTTFTNTDLSVKHTATSLVLNCGGLTSSPYTPSEGIRLHGFTIEGNPIDGRQVNAVGARNAKDIVIDGLNIHSFSLGCGILAASLQGRWAFTNNWIHDFAEDSVWLSTDNPQMTGIEIDNDKINSIVSVPGRITGNLIENLLPGPNFYNSRGYESDGINLQTGPDRVIISGNIIRNVGEGVDSFATGTIIQSNILENCAIAAVKLIHGASSTQVLGNHIKGYGISGVVLSGSGNVGTDMVDTIVSDNRISGGGYGPVAATGTICAIRIQNSGAPATSWVRKSQISGNRITIGTLEEYVFLDDSNGSDNIGFNNYITIDTGGGGALISRVLVSSGSTKWFPLIASRTKASPSSDQSIPTATFTKLELGNVTLDTNSEVNTTDHRWVAKEPNYSVVAHARVRLGSPGNAGTKYQLRVRKNDIDISIEQFVVHSNTERSFTITTSPFSVVAGDNVAVFVYQDSGSSVTVTADPLYTFLSIVPG